MTESLTFALFGFIFLSIFAFSVLSWAAFATESSLKTGRGIGVVKQRVASWS